MYQLTTASVFLATTLPLFFLNFFASCDLLPEPNPSSSYGAYVKCPRRELSDLIGEPSLGNHGFRIKISGNPERYVPGQMYTGKVTFCFFVLFINAVQSGQLCVCFLLLSDQVLACPCMFTHSFVPESSLPCTFCVGN